MKLQFTTSRCRRAPRSGTDHVAEIELYDGLFAAGMGMIMPHRASVRIDPAMPVSVP